MAELLIASIARNNPWMISEQNRLFQKYLQDDYELVVFDNSDHEQARFVQGVCRETGLTYIRMTDPRFLHNVALNTAFQHMRDAGAPYLGFVDGDLWPTEPVSLIPLIREAGFLALGQTYVPKGWRYPWPGFFFCSREWLGGRELNFDGIRGAALALNGDCGSGLHDLFTAEDWARCPSMRHGYERIRDKDYQGSGHTQSHSVEYIGSFLHMGNSARWMEVPDPDGRERIVREMVAAL